MSSDTAFVPGPVPIEDVPQFPGSRSKFVEHLSFIEPDKVDGIPVYRVMDRKGNIIDPSQDPQVNMYFSFYLFKHSCLVKVANLNADG